VVGAKYATSTEKAHPYSLTRNPGSFHNKSKSSTSAVMRVGMMCCTVVTSVTMSPSALEPFISHAGVLALESGCLLLVLQMLTPTRRDELGCKDGHMVPEALYLHCCFL
jgi:hypothetical protein